MAIYRFRPLGVDKCLHDILMLTPLPDSGERPPPAKPVELDIETPYVAVEAFKGNRLAAVLDQDTDKPLHRSERSAVNHDGSMRLVVRADIFELESFRLREKICQGTNPERASRG